MLAPEGVEVAGDDDRLLRGHDEIVQMLQLRMAVTELQGKMHEKDCALLELELDDQTLDSFVEIVKALAMHSRRGQERVALVAQDREPLVQRSGAVLALVNGVVPERARDDVGLVDAARPDRPRVDLDEPDDVRVL